MKPRHKYVQFVNGWDRFADQTIWETARTNANLCAVRHGISPIVDLMTGERLLAQFAICDGAEKNPELAAMRIAVAGLFQPLTPSITYWGCPLYGAISLLAAYDYPAMVEQMARLKADLLRYVMHPSRMHTLAALMLV
jgi:hypothetical protein